MKIIVTGATGFLGQRVCQKLKNSGYDVIALGRNQKIGNRLGVPFIPLDLRNELKEPSIKGDAMIHCAALSSPWGSKTDFLQNNVVATENVIQACLENGIRRLIHVSTSSLYFDFNDRILIKETDPLPKSFANHYAATKWLAEMAVDSVQGLETITIRPRGIYGPGDTVLFPRLLRANLKKGVPLFNNGEAIIDITYVDNVADALILCVEAGDHCLGKKYNITNDDPQVLYSLLEKVCDATGHPLNTISIPFGIGYAIAALLEGASSIFPIGEPLMTRYTLGLLAKSQTLDITAAKRDLNYAPKVSIEEGIQRFAKWWRNQK